MPRLVAPWSQMRDMGCNAFHANVHCCGESMAMATLFAIGIQALVLVVILVISLLMPAMTRRDLLFGVTVAHNARDTVEGKAIIRRYRIGVLLVAIIEAIGLALLW